MEISPMIERNNGDDSSVMVFASQLPLGITSSAVSISGDKEKGIIRLNAENWSSPGSWAIRFRGSILPIRSNRITTEFTRSKVGMLIQEPCKEMN